METINCNLFYIAPKQVCIGWINSVDTENLISLEDFKDNYKVEIFLFENL